MAMNYFKVPKLKFNKNIIGTLSEEIIDFRIWYYIILFSYKFI